MIGAQESDRRRRGRSREARALFSGGDIMRMNISLLLAGVFCLFLFIYTTALVLRRKR